MNVWQVFQNQKVHLFSRCLSIPYPELTRSSTHFTLYLTQHEVSKDLSRLGLGFQGRLGPRAKSFTNCLFVSHQSSPFLPRPDYRVFMGHLLCLLRLSAKELKAQEIDTTDGVIGQQEPGGCWEQLEKGRASLPSTPDHLIMQIRFYEQQQKLVGTKHIYVEGERY